MRNESEIAIPPHSTSFQATGHVRARRDALLVLAFRGNARRPWSRRPAFRQGYPGHADIAIDEGLAGHAVTLLKVLLGQVLALLRLDGVGVREATFDSTSAGAAQSAAAFEGDAALLAERHPQQIAVLRRGDGLAVVGDEGDLDHRGVLSGRRARSSAASCPCDRTS